MESDRKCLSIDYTDRKPGQLDQAERDSALFEAMSRHITANIGPIIETFDDVLPVSCNVSVFLIGPTETRPFQTIMTCGAAQHPMRIPDGHNAHPYIELYMDLTTKWPIPPADIVPHLKPDTREKVMWPLLKMQELAHYPHLFGSYFAPGHTIGNGEPPDPYVEGTKLCATLLTAPISIPPEHHSIRVDDAREVRLLKMLPLHLDELQYAMTHGSEAFMQEHAARLPVPLILNRPSVIQPKRKKLLGLF